MKFPFYRGDGKSRSSTPAKLPLSKLEILKKPDKYLADPGLVDACNVALLLGQPLLLTGEPGTGKTLFAYSLAWELGYEEPLKFETKSTSTARELFYTFDALRRFHDAQSNIPPQNPLVYLTYHALGTAILRTQPEDKIKQFLPPDFKHPGTCRSIVLIDEVDKAPRDFPNDILNELEHMYFRVPELGNQKIEADPELKPLVIITSNSEKDLPDAFLRRCIYYDVPFPERERLMMIITNRLEDYIKESDEFLDYALDYFYKLREPASGLRKKPATSELLGWMITLKEVFNENNPLSQPHRALQILSNLVKTADDQRKAREITRNWIESLKT